MGDPVGGVTVEWFVRERRRHRQHQGETTTDVNGVSQVSWILGPIVGTQTVQAVAPCRDLAGQLRGDCTRGSDGGGGDGGGAAAVRIIR